MTRQHFHLLVWAVLSIIKLERTVAFSAQTSTTATKREVNVGFDQWVADAPYEIATPKELQVEGTIPDYVKGSLVRNGGAIWTLDDQVKSAHIFDGLAKLSQYEINNGKVRFNTRFVESSLKTKLEQAGQNIPTVHTGPLMDRKTNQAIPQKNWIQALFNIPWFDNVPVNVWKYDQNTDQVACLTDTPIRATVQQATLKTIQTAKQPSSPQNAPPFSFYELSGTAHPEYCKAGTGVTYNVGTHIALPHPQLCLVRETPQGDRKVIASYPLTDNKIPYLHSFGLTPTKAIVVLQPLRQNSITNMLQEGFLPTMEHVDSTKVLVWNLKSGELLADTTLPEPVYFYHSISTTDTNQGVSFQLCGYKVPDQITGPDQFFRFDRANTPEGRNRIHPGGILCNIQVDLDQSQVTIQWADVLDTLSNTPQGFELPTTRYSRTTPPANNQQHPKFAYAFGAYARGSPDYDAWAILKIDTTTGQAVSFREGPSCYYSEPIFVPDPEGTEEDDGVLLCTRLDGNTETTSLLVIEAKTMQLLAKASTEVRVPMDFHGAFFPLQT